MVADHLLQNIAAENNLSETSFYVLKGDEYELRWFTPKAEIDLCGHATLAAAFVLFEIEKYDKPELKFQTRSGLLTVSRNGNRFVMNFPLDELKKKEITEEIKSALKINPVEVYHGKNVLLVVMNSEKELRDINPNPEKVKILHRHGMIVTAQGDHTDFVSRCFFPNFGINEDPVTGSAHTILTPYWANRLNKKELTAKQLSERTGDLNCRLENGRVFISGEAVLFLKGKIFIP
jgi:PhzF family phenazine biosynthesis protein